MAAMPVPATPAALRGRVAAALAARYALPPRRAFRPFLVGGLLLGGAALAAAIALHLAPDDADSPPVMVGAGEEAPLESTSVATPSTETAAAAPAQEPTKAVAEIPLDPHRILVVLQKEAAADAQALVFAGRCRDGAVRELRALGGLNIVADSAVYTADSLAQITGLTEQIAKVARGQGAGKVLAISTEMGCNASLFDTSTRKMLPGGGMGGVDPEGERVDAFAKNVALMARSRTLMDPNAELADARATVLNQALSDQERVSALWKPLSLSPSGDAGGSKFYDVEVVAAAIQVAQQSTDAEVRTSAWAALRHVADPALVKPLLQALANDPDRSVRYQAAFDLNTFLDQPGVREGLQRAAAGDPDSQPSVDCCLFTVREAAQRALVPARDFRNWAHASLFDTSLPARARLLSVQPSSPDGRFAMLSSPGFGIEAARVVFEIGRDASTTQARLMAWNALKFAPTDETFISVLVSDMTNYPEQSVRIAAANALQAQAGNAEVRAAFERALNDSSIDVRRAAEQALKQPAR